MERDIFKKNEVPFEKLLQTLSNFQVKSVCVVGDIINL
jgi:hypothetical protein